MGLRNRHGKRTLFLGQVPLHVPESVRGGAPEACVDHPVRTTLCSARAQCVHYRQHLGLLLKAGPCVALPPRPLLWTTPGHQSLC